MIKIDLTPKMWVYHRKECPEGRIVTLPEGDDILAKGGWVKTPADFPKAVKKPTEVQKDEPKENELKEDVPHETIEEIKL